MEVKFYTEPGRGRKGCPKCNKYVGVKTATCPCGYDFSGGSLKALKPEEPKEIVTYDEGGKGKKQCPSCKKYLGARNLLCPCGHNFQEAKVVTVEPSIQEIREVLSTVELPKRESILPTVHAPAGTCFVPLTGTDEATVEKWVERLRAQFRAKGEHLSVEGLKYWVRGFYDFFSPEHETVCNIIERVA